MIVVLLNTHKKNPFFGGKENSTNPNFPTYFGISFDFFCNLIFSVNFRNFIYSIAVDEADSSSSTLYIYKGIFYGPGTFQCTMKKK